MRSGDLKNFFAESLRRGLRNSLEIAAVLQKLGKALIDDSQWVVPEEFLDFRFDLASGSLLAGAKQFQQSRRGLQPLRVRRIQIGRHDAALSLSNADELTGKHDAASAGR